MAGETENTLGSKTEARIFVPESAVRSMAGKKVGRVSWNWHDTWQEEHKHSFVVAKMAKADLLNEVYKSLQDAMKNGTPCAEWKKKILPKLEGRWIGKTIGELWDELPEEEKANRIPPSEKEREKVISPRRLDTIYRTNMHIAYMAGRYENQMASAEYLPYWRYRTVGDSRVRDSHRVLNNKVFKYDDPFWRTHYPPNGWGCRCEVSSLDEEEVKELGLTISSSEGHARTSADEVTGKPVFTYEFDGKTVRTAPGWNYNPADSLKASIEQAKAKAEAMPPKIGKKLADDADKVNKPQNPEKTKLKKIKIDKEPKILSPDEYKAWLDRQLPLVDNIHDLEKQIWDLNDDKEIHNKKQELNAQKDEIGQEIAKSGQVAAITKLPNVIIITRNSIIEKVNQKAAKYGSHKRLESLSTTTLYIDIFSGAHHSIRKDKSQPNYEALRNLHEYIKRALTSKENYEGVFYEYNENDYTSVHDGDIIFVVADRKIDKTEYDKFLLTKIIVKEHKRKLWVKTIQRITNHDFDGKEKGKSWVRIKLDKEQVDGQPPPSYP